MMAAVFADPFQRPKHALIVNRLWWARLIRIVVSAHNQGNLHYLVKFRQLNQPKIRIVGHRFATENPVTLRRVPNIYTSGAVGNAIMKRKQSLREKILASIAKKRANASRSVVTQPPGAFQALDEVQRPQVLDEEQRINKAMGVVQDRLAECWLELEADTAASIKAGRRGVLGRVSPESPEYREAKQLVQATPKRLFTYVERYLFLIFNYQKSLERMAGEKDAIERGRIVQSANAEARKLGLTKEKQIEGKSSTEDRPEIRKTELFTFIVGLLKREPNIANGKKAHIEIANRARTEEAAQSSFEHKNWNKTANRKNASFISEREMRKAVKAALPSAIRAARPRAS
jgi:hypothetical protein